MLVSINLRTFAPAFETSEHWRDGRVVDYSSLENYRTERYRGFESLSLRKEFSNSWILFFAFKGGIRKLVVSLVNNALLAELSPTIVKAYFPVAQQPW